MSKDKRKFERVDVNEPGVMAWQDEQGNTLAERVVMLNVSDHGAMVEALHNHPLRLSVQIKVPTRKIDSSATVRYCHQIGGKYRIGLELSQSTAAKPKQGRWT
ncbi:MAG: PilZ domain-containing protein [Chloroflexia bacterium]